MVFRMSTLFEQRVATQEGFSHELHVIKVKLFFGVLNHPEDSYMWPYLLVVWDKFGNEPE